MVLESITNMPADQGAGFSQSQFRLLDQLYCRAASLKTLNYRAVDCDFDEGVASYTYYKSAQHSPFLQLLIRKVGPRTVMYEVYQEGKGRILKSGLFEKAYETIRDCIHQAE